MVFLITDLLLNIYYLNGVLVDMGLALRTTFYGVILANLIFKNNLAKK